MNENNGNLPAFTNTTRHCGLTKLEYFSVMILQGMITAGCSPESATNANTAVRSADILLKALKNGDNND
jgi:hypothetical protein